MNPIEFKGANKVFTKPKGWTDEECSPLHVQVEGERLISKWAPDEIERKALAAGKPVTLTIYGGGHPPVSLFVEHDCEHPAHKADRADGLEAAVALGTTTIDPADAAQAYIDGLCEKMESAVLAEHDLMIIAEGRIKTIIMENVAELRLMSEDANASDIVRINAGRLSIVYANFAKGMSRDIEKLMLATRLIK